jgi:ubiquinone/menaquinone biosynthesis C-methylase UbiE
LLPERRSVLERFVHEYEIIRQAEGRGSEEAAYYLALPFADLSGKRREEWRIRAQSFKTLLAHVVEPLQGERPMRILDLGAGNGWLSNRLSLRGNRLVAVDLGVSALDGLGAHIHYDHPFLLLQAEFDRLPLAGRQFDLAVFNSSFHYSSHYETTLGEAARMVKVGGKVVIVDTPVYHDGNSGEQMVRERQDQFRKRYGFPSSALESENYLTYRRLIDLKRELCRTAEMHWPIPEWRWNVRRWKARLGDQREPAQFPIITFQIQ